MKRMLSVIIALAMVMLGEAYAEEGELHLLWGIEFGQDIETVQEILKNEHGLDTIYEEFTYPYENGENWTAQRLRLNETNALTMVGYPVRSFVWLQTNTLTEQLSLDFSNLNYTIEEARTFFITMITALMREYGEIDFAVLEVYSDGFDAWMNDECRGIHEVRHLADLDVQSLDLETLLESLDYDYNNAYVILEAFIDNIQISYSKYDGENYSMRICFSNRVLDDIYIDMLEDFS